MNIRGLIFKLLRAKPEDIAGETYNHMVSRHDRECIDFQNNCNHRVPCFKYSPIMVCDNCQKPLRYMTADEMQYQREIFLNQIERAKEEEKTRV